MALLTFLAISIASAALWHKKVRDFGVAVLAATLTTVVLFQAIGFLVEGRVDSLVGVAVVFSAFWAALISVLIGLPFRARRKGSDAGAP